MPYVIVYGTPGLPLIQLVRCPHDLLADPSLRINSTYYITRQILPPLGRIFSLMGVDVMKWYSDLPRVTRSVRVNRRSLLKENFALLQPVVWEFVQFLPCDVMRSTVLVIVILSVRLSVCPSVCPSVTLVHCVHMVRPTIMISSPYGSPIILVSGDITFIPKFEGDHPKRGH